MNYKESAPAPATPMCGQCGEARTTHCHGCRRCADQGHALWCAEG